MLNAMPLPAGPTEASFHMDRTEERSFATEKKGAAQERESFASTLRAVEGEHKTTDNETRCKPDKRHETDKPSENSKPTSASEKTEEHDADPKAMVDETAAGQVDTARSGDNLETTAGVAVLNSAQTAIEGEMKEGTEGIGENGSAEAQIESPLGMGKGAVEKKADGISQSRPTESAGPVPTLPKGQATSPTTSPGLSASPTENAQMSAMTVAEKGDPSLTGPAKERGEGKTLSDEAWQGKFGDGLQEAIDGENHKCKGDNASGDDEKSDMNKLAKPLQNKDTGRHKENGIEASKRSAIPESPKMTRAAANGDVSVEHQMPSSDPGRDAMHAKMSDEAGPSAGRQNATDAGLSFSSTTTADKAAAPSPSTGTSTSMTDSAGRFHQDNFHQLVERAMFSVRGEQSEARIALKPDQLGHVHMKVVTENHMVTIKIMTESPAARDMIHANAHQLKTELQQQGLTVEQIEVSVSDDQNDAYRDARQRESFMGQLTSRGKGEPGSATRQTASGWERPTMGRPQVNGIDYFA